MPRAFAVRGVVGCWAAPVRVAQGAGELLGVHVGSIRSRPGASVPARWKRDVRERTECSRLSLKSTLPAGLRGRTGRQPTRRSEASASERRPRARLDLEDGALLAPHMPAVHDRHRSPPLDGAPQRAIAREEDVKRGPHDEQDVRGVRGAEGVVQHRSRHVVSEEDDARLEDAAAVDARGDRELERGLGGELRVPVGGVVHLPGQPARVRGRRSGPGASSRAPRSSRSRGSRLPRAHRAASITRRLPAPRVKSIDVLRHDVGDDGQPPRARRGRDVRRFSAASRTLRQPNAERAQ